jgi:hypothetical protein
MNHISQRNKLEVRLKNYKDFTGLCPPDSFPKLVQEMMKIHCRIEKIRSLRVPELMEEVEFQFETKQSKMNFKTI